MKYKIKVVTPNKTISAQENEILSDIIQKSGINLSTYCNKKGLCGKCLVEIIKGDLPELKEKEQTLIKEKNLNPNYRLACQYKIKSDLEIKIPDTSLIEEVEILKTGISIPVTIDPAVKKFDLQLSKPEITSPDSFLGIIKKHFKNDALKINYELLRKLPDILKKNKYKVSIILFDDDEILDVVPVNTKKTHYGIAIDIGTSTIVAELIDLSTGDSLDAEFKTNSRVKYGSDVVSRISFAHNNPKNLNILQETVLEILNEMIHDLTVKCKIDVEDIYEAVIAGNTAMNHFFLRVPVENLAVAPFNAVFTELSELKACDIELRINKYGKIYIVPNIKSFVGGDICAGIISSDLINKNENLLFIDLGTNGEIVLKFNDKIIVTSTAAGPAFEGINISNGMMAVSGAVYKAEYKDKLILHTINDKPPIGICGTGLIDLVSIFLENGEIADNGQINNEQKKLEITDKIFIIQKDIREVQLAVGAIKAGTKTLLDKYNCPLEKLDRIMIAGAFGSHLNIENAKRIGLLPQFPLEKISFLGNSSLAGAKALLISYPLREKISQILPEIEHCSLGMNSQFQEYFIDAMNFQNFL